MFMSDSYTTQLYLDLGLATQKKAKDGFILCPYRDGWDHFFANEKKLSMESTSIWKGALQNGSYSTPKLCISSVALSFASNIGWLFSVVGPQGTSMCRRSPRVSRIPYKSGHFSPHFLKEYTVFF